MRAGDAQHVLGDGTAGVEGGARHAPENPLGFGFLILASLLRSSFTAHAIGLQPC